ncbi:MAG: HRDC domain-containing protein [Kiritimatiellae bacterium]|nr:HRDC domain-containing protein [Kiritimatiellia bacterium]
MQIRVITMRYSEGLQGFPEDALRTATFGREVLAMEQHFFVHGNVPHIALVLSLADAGGAERGSVRQDRGGEAAKALEAQLPEERRPVYLALKDWRNRTAKAQGCPAYAIARNRQLAELVMKAPKTLAALKEIEGCGESFARQYGDAVLHMLAEVTPGEGPAPSEGSSMTDVSEEDTRNK